MRLVRVAELKPGMVIELTGGQTLFDMTVVPWRELAAGSRLEVIGVTAMATGRTDRQPYAVELRTTDSGARVALEVADGEYRVSVV